MIVATLADNLTALATVITALAVLLTAWRSNKKADEVKETLEKTNEHAEKKLDNITTLVNGHTSELKKEIRELNAAATLKDLAAEVTTLRQQLDRSEAISEPEKR